MFVGIQFIAWVCCFVCCHKLAKCSGAVGSGNWFRREA